MARTTKSANTNAFAALSAADNTPVPAVSAPGEHLSKASARRKRKAAKKAAESTSAINSPFADVPALNATVDESSSSSSDDGWTTLNPKIKKAAKQHDKDATVVLKKQRISKTAIKNAQVVGAIYVITSTANGNTKNSYANAATTVKQASLIPKVNQQLKAAPKPATVQPDKAASKPAIVVTAPKEDRFKNPVGYGIPNVDRSKATPKAPVARSARIAIDGVLTPDTNPAANGIVANGSWKLAQGVLAKPKDFAPEPSTPASGPNPKDTASVVKDSSATSNKGKKNKESKGKKLSLQELHATPTECVTGPEPKLVPVSQYDPATMMSGALPAPEIQQNAELFSEYPHLARHAVSAAKKTAKKTAKETAKAATKTKPKPAAVLRLRFE
jgi:hypothetical protein